MKRHLCAALTFALAACGTMGPKVLTKPGLTQEEFTRDLRECEYDGYKYVQNYDPAMRTIVGQVLDQASRRNDLTQRCMFARGYYLASAIDTPTPPSQASYAQVPSQPPAQVQSPPPQAAQPTTTGEPGRWAYDAERLPPSRACSARPVARLAARGAGSETYTIACASGDTLTVKCEFGNCRALQ